MNPTPTFYDLYLCWLNLQPDDTIYVAPKEKDAQRQQVRDIEETIAAMRRKTLRDLAIKLLVKNGLDPIDGTPLAKSIQDDALYQLSIAYEEGAT